MQMNEGDNNTKKLLWTLIQNLEEENSFDLVPNKWLIHESSCYYPDVSVKTLKSYAKSCTPPDLKWSTILISIVKRDIEDYERGMMNVMRITKGKRSITESDDDRSKNKRKKIEKKMPSYKRFDVTSDADELDSDELCETDEHDSILHPQTPAHPPKQLYITTPTTTLPKTKHTPSIHMSDRSQASPTTSQLNPFQKGSSQTSNKHTSPQSSRAFCKQKTDRKHYCFFQHSSSQPSLEDVGHVLCFITRKLEKQEQSNTQLREEIKSLKMAMLESNKAKSDDHSSSNLNIADFEENPAYWQDFPLSDKAKVMEMDVKLKTSEFFKACVGHFAALAERTSESRTVTSIMAKMLTLETATKYTWVGQARVDHQEPKYSFRDTYLEKVLQASSKRCWPNISRIRIETTASSWLSQAKSKIQRAAKVINKRAAITNPNLEAHLGDQTEGDWEIRQPHTD